MAKKYKNITIYFKEITMMRLKGSVKLAILKIINLLAMLMVVQTANTACIWVVYQPEFPDEAKKMKHIKTK